MLAMALALATTGGGYLLVLAVIVPVIGMLASLVIGGRHAERIALALMPAGIGLSLAIAIEVWVTGQPLVYTLGEDFMPTKPAEYLDPEAAAEAAAAVANQGR